MLGSLFTHIIVMSLVAFSSSLVYGGTDPDRDSLLAFKAKISRDPLGILSSWNDSAHFCQWNGVKCGSRQRRVTMLDLFSQQLEGTLSPHIGNLSFLRTLNLQNNSFNHEIPQELGGLFRLQKLLLGNNALGGEIPANISRCSNLEVLTLGGNHLGGKLPPELEFLSKLRLLNLQHNKFVSEIPVSFGNLSSLERISLVLSNLHGSIPSTFGQLKRLTHLFVGGNRLSGPIPPSVFNLSSLTRLALHSNQFNGSLPPDIGFTLPKLVSLNIFTNQFSGPIPVSISNASSLQIISIPDNRFSGKVPSLGSLHDLRKVVFRNNDLGNFKTDDLNFISSLVNCTNLEQLILSDNNFGGEMPQLISNFSTNIKWITLGRNHIQGSIPTDIGNLINLERLGMETNQLTDAIPRSVGKLQKLNVLLFDGNKLSGSIPSSLGNLTSLISLNLRLNNLQGHIPSSLGGCRNLLLISLSQNNLSGTIPKELLSISSLSRYVDLSENRLIGSLPLEVGKLVNLGILDISENNLSGEIPNTIGSCTSLEGLFMEGNLLQGEIPSLLSSLRGLQWLDLSRNNLSGQVPKYLGEFIFLQYLNLSFNDFEGEIPAQGVFSNVSVISAFGNRKLCGGIPELNLPMCTYKKQGISSKRKLIISLVCGIVGVILMLSLLILYRSRKNRKLSKSSSSMGISIPKVSYDDLLKATDGYSPVNLIGVGAFASVYKGILGQEGSVVAVKVLNLQHRGASKSFMAECEALRSIRHRNLVKILTACSSVDFQGNDFKALVYEFMINGSLEDWLHLVHRDEAEEQKHLNFLQRINIAIDVANALDYMHNDCQVPIIHCDLKPTNILLDDDMTARVGDFGLARLCPEATRQSSSNQTSSIGIKGSIGYAAPEYGMGSEVSTYGDVYSYGIMLLEMFTGKRPIDNMFKDGLNLHSFAMMALPGRVVEIGDPMLFKIYNEELINETTRNIGQFARDKILDCLTLVVEIGVACSEESPRERMNIRKVAEELQKIRDNFVGTGVH